MKVEWPSKWWEWLALIGAFLPLLSFKRKKGEISMGEQKGTKELAEVVDLIVDAIQAGTMVMADGKIAIDDITKLAGLIPDLLPAVAGLDQIPAELADLSFDEGHVLVLHVVQKLNITSGRALQIVNASVKAAAAIYELVLAIKSPADPIPVAPAPGPSAA